MNGYEKLTAKQIDEELTKELKIYEELRGRGTSVDMTRGRPSKEQLEIAMPMLKNAGSYDYTTTVGDARNYGEPAGIKPARELFAQVLEVAPENVARLT